MSRHPSTVDSEDMYTPENDGNKDILIRLSPPTSGSVRRRARERKRALETRAEGERIARERREQRDFEKMEHQRMAREQPSYEPWGRAGGGAPNPHGIRFSNLRATGIYPEDELKGVSQYEACRRWPSPRRGGRGLRRRTPLRLREDPQLCYADTLRKSVENDIRYRQTPDQQKTYKDILDDMVDKRNKALKDEKKRNLEFERKMGWTDNDAFNKLKGDHRRHKRSSLALPKVKREDDRRDDKENIKPSSVDKLPDIKHTNSPANSREESRRNSSEKKEVNATKSRGKRSPKKSKFVKRLSNGERVMRFVPDEGLENVLGNGDASCSREKKLTPEATILRLTGGIELVPLLARKRHVGARTLHSSDVTRQAEQACQWRDVVQVDYLRDLKHQVQVKYERNKECRRDSAESVLKHHDTFASMWGRPGHGAPQCGRYARSNLARLLYVAPLANVTQNAQ